MFDATKVKEAYKNLVGWRQYHNINDINVPVELQESESGEFFQSKHVALSLDNIQLCLRRDYPLDKYLEDVKNDAIVEVFNDLLQYRQLRGYGKTLLENSLLLNKLGYGQDKIINQGRFVGFKIRLYSVEGLKMAIKSVGFQMDSAIDFKLYLFHTSKTEPLKTFDVSTSIGSGWDWLDNENEFDLTSFKLSDYNGGVFILGYYQEDLLGTQAINYTDFDWSVGECGTCNNSYGSTWNDISEHYHIFPIYCPKNNYIKGETLDLSKCIYESRKSWGLNLRLSVVCDLTDFFIENRFAFKSLLQWKVVTKVLQMMKHSTEINAMEEEIKMMIIRDLEGDKETHLTNTPQEYKNELKSVSWNISKINQLCLKCEDFDAGPFIGVL